MANHGYALHHRRSRALGLSVSAPRSAHLCGQRGTDRRPGRPWRCLRGGVLPSAPGRADSISDKPGSETNCNRKEPLSRQRRHGSMPHPARWSEVGRAVCNSSGRGDLIGQWWGGPSEVRPIPPVGNTLLPASRRTSPTAFTLFYPPNFIHRAH